MANTFIIDYCSGDLVLCIFGLISSGALMVADAITWGFCSCQRPSIREAQALSVLSLAGKHAVRVLLACNSIVWHLLGTTSPVTNSLVIYW
jgi:hypothetical protein